MSMQYIEVPGEEVESHSLSIPYAIDFGKAVTESGFTTLLKCKKIDDNIEIIVFETEIQRPQKTVHDIHYKERLAVYFFKNDLLPVVYSLRDNFPNVPHVNLTEEEFPRSLCIYEESFDELKLKWTGFKFLEDIRYWFALTAVGKLHSEDQPLEFLLLPTSKFLIVNIEDLLDIRLSKPQPYSISSITSENGRETLFLQKSQPGSKNLFNVCIVVGDPQMHGIIKKRPRNLYELSEFTRNAKIDLIIELQTLLKQWKDDKDLKGIEQASLIIIIVLPKKRNDSSGPEQFEIIAYKLNEPISVIGKEIGLWDIFNGEIGYLFPKDETKNGNTLIGELLNPMYSFHEEIAQGTTGL